MQIRNQIITACTGTALAVPKIADAIGATTGDVKRELPDLVRKGRLTKHGRGRGFVYTATERPAPSTTPADDTAARPDFIAAMTADNRAVVVAGALVHVFNAAQTQELATLMLANFSQ